MGKVYLLQHVYEVDKIDEVKLIGIFSTEEKSQKIIEELIKKNGFKDLSIDCFVISEIEIDKHSWQDGFINWTDA